MPTDLLQQIEETISSFRAEIDARLSEWLGARRPSEFRGVELGLAGLGRALCDALMGILLGMIVNEAEFQAKAVAAAQETRRLRNGGAREVTVTFLGGSKAGVRVPYLRPDRRGLRGRRRGCGRRGRGGAGLYPTLEALGIWAGVSPALAGEVVRQVADSEAVRPAREALSRRGINLGQKQTLRIVNKFGLRAVDQREEWLRDASSAAPSPGPLSGRRVVIGTDGGRTRIRKPSRGRRRNNGHRRYDAPWKEPKIIVIYLIDAQGHPLREFRPVYDGTMGDCDAVFAMLVGYLKALGAAHAAQLIVVADGAKWIWNRVPEIADALGLSSSKICQVLDWFHAVETLHSIADIPSKSNISPHRRAKWIKHAKKLLHSGRINDLLAHIRTLAVGRRAKKINRYLAYFEKNETRMQYSTFQIQKIPLGSGAVESTVRRVVNMRLKSNSKFWYEENAESMLLLRSYLKAGRFDDLFDWSICTAVSWWCSESSPIREPDRQESSLTILDVGQRVRLRNRGYSRWRAWGLERDEKGRQIS
ncbi:hypothetical protein KKB55_22910 [Myxococcota bacterium]|nr:hypothetical protein [Myxococcota bacterium]